MLARTLRILTLLSAVCT